jgi:hypothetical protein
MNTTKKTAGRIYLVRHSDTGCERLIRASTAAQARNHAARDSIEVDVASQEQLVALLTGESIVPIEDASLRDAEAEAEPAAQATKPPTPTPSFDLPERLPPYTVPRRAEQKMYYKPEPEPMPDPETFDGASFLSRVISERGR